MPPAVVGERYGAIVSRRDPSRVGSEIRGAAAGRLHLKRAGWRVWTVRSSPCRGSCVPVPCQIATPRHATDPPHPRLIHLVQRESAPGRQRRASWLLCSLTGMTLKAPKSPPQPVRLTDSEDVFCKAVGLDSNDHNDRLLLSEVKVGTQIERCFYVSHTG